MDYTDAKVFSADLDMDICLRHAQFIDEYSHIYPYATVHRHAHEYPAPFQYSHDYADTIADTHANNRTYRHSCPNAVEYASGNGTICQLRQFAKPRPTFKP